MAYQNSAGINVTGIVTLSSSGSPTGSSVTQYGTVVAGTNNTVSSVAPSAGSGIPLISMGSSANPAFGTAVVAGGGTGLATTTAYGLIAGGTTATGNFQNTGAGSSGQVLQSNGAASLPTWVAPSSVGGSLVLISSQSPSSSSTISFTSIGSYACYLVIIEGVTNSAGGNIQCLISDNGGSSYFTTGYAGGVNYNEFNTTVMSNLSGSTSIPMSGVIGSGASQFSYQCNMFFQVNTYFYAWGEGAYTDSLSGGTSAMCKFMGNRGSTGTNAIQFSMTTGTMSGGTISLYGISNS